MPAISRIGVLVVCMYMDDHGPPHFHLRKGHSDCSYRIDPPGVLAGRLPPGYQRKVRAWAIVHRAALLENWTILQSGSKPHRIPVAE